MPYNDIKLENKVNALKEAIVLTNVSEIAKKYGISEKTIYHCYNILIGYIPKILEGKKPGPKIKLENNKAKTNWINRKIVSFKRWIFGRNGLQRCKRCGSTRIHNNGGYWVKNSVKSDFI